jgi:hypothetical protein
MNPNQFRRPPNARQMMQRERRNQDDQRLLTPFQNNAVEETKGMNDIEDDSIAHLHEIDLPLAHLTQQEYENLLTLNQSDGDDREKKIELT